MADFSVCVRNKKKNGMSTVFIRLCHNHATVYIKTEFFVTDEELSRTGEVRDAFVQEQCARRISRYVAALKRMDIRRKTAAEVKRVLVAGELVESFSKICADYIDAMLDRGQRNNAKVYLAALRSFEEFMGSKDVRIGQVTRAKLREWVADLERRTRRARELYPINVRQMWRHAIDYVRDTMGDVAVPEVDPWQGVKFVASETGEKKAVTVEVCRRFFAASLPVGRKGSERAQLGQDVAMMVLCLAGMNTIDLYGLRKEDYRDGVLRYNRSKTAGRRRDKAYFEIRVPEMLLPVFERHYAADDSEMLFCFSAKYRSPESFAESVKAGIWSICSSEGMPRMSAYTFRHTWATIAQNHCEANLADIAFAMNHSSGHRVTRGYVKLNFAPAWRLNEKVVAFVFGEGVGNDAPDSRRHATAPSFCSGLEIAPRAMVYARAYFRGEMLAEVSDIGFGTIDEVIARLTPKLPDTIPTGCAVQFRIKNVDEDREAMYERTKGKGF